MNVLPVVDELTCVTVKLPTAVALMYQVPAPYSVAALAVTGVNVMTDDAPQFLALTVVVALLVAIVNCPVR